jgi:hydroxymethylpyrimidine/phosphomethylpyrimidine kinase
MDHAGFPAVCLSIGVSDSSGSGGTQADLKTFTALSVYGVSIVTGVAAHSLGTLHDLHILPESTIRSQLEAASEDLPISGVKVGFCPSLAIMRVVARWLRERPALRVVIDPVARDSRGIPLLSKEQVACLKEELLPRATVATPNRFEAALLTGMDDVLAKTDMEQAAKLLLKTHGCPVLVTGGGLQGQSLDVLAGLDGVRHFSFPTVQRAKIHGTGATFSAAVAASLSKGDSLREAILAAKLYVSAAISAAPSLDNGRSALWHSVTVREQVIATQSDEWPAVQVHQRSRAMTPLQGNPIIPPL